MQIGQKRKEVAEKRDRMDAGALTTILFRCLLQLAGVATHALARQCPELRSEFGHPLLVDGSSHVTAAMPAAPPLQAV